MGAIKAQFDRDRHPVIGSLPLGAFRRLEASGWHRVRDRGARHLVRRRRPLKLSGDQGQRQTTITRTCETDVISIEEMSFVESFIAAHNRPKRSLRPGMATHSDS